MNENSVHLSNDSAFVAFLESLVSRERRDVLANLRRGLGRPPGTVLEMFPYVARYASGMPRNDENAYFIVAALFGLFPKPSWKSDDSRRCSLGHSLAFLKDDSGSIERRFVALLNADTEDLPNYLRQIVSLLKARDAPINWHKLLADLKNWSSPNRRVQREWARGFWGAADHEFNKQENR